jgi:hypothetical protein
MRFFLFGAAGALIFGGSGFSPWLGAVIGLVVAIVLTPRGTTKRVIIEDVTTGKIEIQPNDRATRNYIAGRGE